MLLTGEENIFYGKVLRAALRMKVPPPYLALVLAVTQQESTRRGGGITPLALKYNNLCGYKFLPGKDDGRYLPVALGPNAEETRRGLGPQTYRIFDSFEHCVDSMTYLFWTSPSYARARAKLPDFRAYIDALYEVWSIQLDDGPRAFANWRAWTRRLDQGWKGTLR